MVRVSPRSQLFMIVTLNLRDSMRDGYATKQSMENKITIAEDGSIIRIGSAAQNAWGPLGGDQQWLLLCVVR